MTLLPQKGERLLFDFEDWIDALKLLLIWAALCLVFPLAWWLLHAEWILGQMLRSKEGVAMLSLGFSAALVAVVLGGGSTTSGKSSTS